MTAKKVVGRVCAETSAGFDSYRCVIGIVRCSISISQIVALKRPDIARVACAPGSSKSNDDGHCLGLGPSNLPSRKLVQSEENRGGKISEP